MKLIKCKTLVLVLIIFFTGLVTAQNNEVTESVNKSIDSSYIALSLNYISDAVFMGRKDSISTPYLYPSITFHHKSGFYANGSFSYLTKSNESRVDLSLITLGYDFRIKKFEGDISVTKYFFNENSYNVISQVETDLTVSLAYDFDVIKFGVMASSFFSNDSNTDLILVSELSRDFITKNQRFQTSPTIGAYFGSQNFYEQYYINTQFGSGQGQGQGGNDNVLIQNNIKINESEKFNLMAIELSLPIWYVYKSYAFLFAPNLVLPQNESELSIDNIVVKENLETTFYWMLGVSYTF
ncbi:hypothetical protein [Olleya namhaensis]|uniref:hypothetical protein n=1 Tax=Olleya namhaensis TaxID=1144750 RepID=UPI00232B14FC|nr:hypothetical protein [Olleya namhaensis]